MDNPYFLFLGVSYLFVGSLDLIHTLSYKGMGIFPNDEANLSTQLWIAARYLESLSLLIAPLFLHRKLNATILFSVYLVISTLLLGSIFYSLFPICFVEGEGLTSFKKISEYIISILLVSSIAILWFYRKAIHSDVLRLLVASILITIGSEIAFTFYIDVYRLSNLLGHLLKGLSFYLIYIAIIRIGLARPYDVLFRTLKQKEKKLVDARDLLAMRIEERTKELSESNRRLTEEIRHRLQAETILREKEDILRKREVDYRNLAGKLLSVQETERRRLAREMHDDLTQRLAVMAIDVDQLARTFQHPNNKVRMKLNQIRENLVKLSEDIHSISRQLHPSILDDLGLYDAVRSECAKFLLREGIRVDFRSESLPSQVPKDIALCIYRIMQEGLRNIAKHAEASSVRLLLGMDNGAIHLSLEDQGKGFDPSTEKARSGLGLVSMQERVRLVNGEFKVTSQPGSGTQIEAIIPLSVEDK